ncbi:MAG TPA: HPr family phosphocarrier protein [Puia sp.]|nr:HPr family phosphocarrier protein [Puia sp.]
MISKVYTILAAEGIHARPATALVRLARQFSSSVYLKKNEAMVKLDSMLNILSLATKAGDVITMQIEGEDEVSAAAVLDQFFTEQLKHL